MSSVSAALLDDVKKYIDECYVDEGQSDELPVYLLDTPKAKLCEFDIYEEEAKCIEAPSMEKYTIAKNVKDRSLSDLLDEADDTFSEALFRLIDAKGMKDSQVYKRANIDRRHFSKIRNNLDYQPSKNTALALAVALELNLDETKDFIGRAGYALSHSSKTDIIIEYFITREEYDIFTINETLFAFDQPCLG